jgi:ABC-type Zn uptake system ZnuABC Zn-binding protein ZnuA
MRQTARWRVPALAMAAVLLGGCGTQAEGGVDLPRDAAGAEPTEEPDLAGPEDAQERDPVEGAPTAPALYVIATVAPIADLVARVGGDRVAVDSLVPPGADSHTYEPRPQDVAVLADADAYLGVGLDLNAGVIDLAEQHLADGAPVVRLGEVALQDGQLVLDHPDDGHSHGEDGHSHGEHGHSHGEDGDLGPNPHVWTSVRNATSMVGAIAEELTALDAEGEDLYAANAEDLIAELESLDQDIEAAAATVPEVHRTLVTYHDAWTYFARDHGFEFVTAVQPGDFSEPSAAEVREVIDLLRDLDVPAIFGSEVFPSRVLDAIAAETGAVYVADLADDALPGSPGDPEHTYVEMMRRNAVTIVDALGGDSSTLER